MLPALQSGQLVVTKKPRQISSGRVVVARLHGRQVIKRVGHVDQGGIYLLGDNPEFSTDSRQKGCVEPKDILGVVWYPRKLDNITNQKHNI